MSLIFAEAPTQRYNDGGKWLVATYGYTAGAGGPNGRPYLYEAGGPGSMQALLNSVDSTVIVGFHWLSTYGNNPIMRVTEPGVTTHGTLWQSDLGALYWAGPTGNIAVTPAASYIPNTWHYIEVKVVVHDTTGSVTIKIDGAIKGQTTGVDTRVAGTGIASGLNFVSNGNITERIADIVIMNSLGTKNNDFIGPVTVEARVPNGAGFYSGWVPLGGGANYLAVDDPATVDHDGDTTYVAASVVATKDTYSYEDLSAAIATVYGVQLFAVGKHDGAAANIRTMIRRAGVDAVVGASEALATSYTIKSLVMMEDDPIAAGDWTVTNVNATEIGIEVI